jgi:hypothetical protein
MRRPLAAAVSRAAAAVLPASRVLANSSLTLDGSFDTLTTGHGFAIRRAPGLGDACGVIVLDGLGAADPVCCGRGRLVGPGAHPPTDQVTAPGPRQP